MRISIIITGLTLFIFSSACEGIIEEEPVSSISSASFWKNEGDVKSALYGMYNQFRSTFDVKTVIWGEFRTGYYDQGSSTTSTWNDLWNNTMNVTTTGSNWSSMYLLINDANMIIAKSADIPFNDQAEKDHILGQAYFARSFTYFQIVKLWGDAPIVTEGFESTEQDLEPSRSPKSAVFAQVKADLDMAISLLGDRESVNFIGIDAANMLKADVYLWTAKLEGGGNDDLIQAQDAIDEVLTAGYILESNFETPFRDKNSAEIIFSIFYSELEVGTGGTSGASGRSQTGTHPAHITLPSLELTPEEFRDDAPVTGSPQWLALSEYFLDNILKSPATDSRSDVSWMSVISGSNSVTWINKYIGEEFSGTRLPTSNLIIYRYAEAILFKAEIENALTNTGEALTQLNKIAKRAYGVDDFYSGLNSAQIDEAILDERILELVLEGKAWYDIRRFGQAFQRVPTLTGREGDNSGNILLFPVAQDVINRNPNIEQTKGY